MDLHAALAAAIGVFSLLGPQGALADQASRRAVEEWLVRSGRPAEHNATTAVQPLSEDVWLAEAATALGAIDPRAEGLLEACQRGEAPPSPPAWIEEGAFPPAVRATLALYVAHGLSARRRYPAVLAWTQPIDPAEAPCPGLLHYLRGTALFGLVQLPKAKAECKALLALGEGVEPWRTLTARTILRRTKAIEPGSPDEIGLLMQDAERGLSIDGVEAEEIERQRAVVAALDALIKNLEEQQQQDQQQSQQQASSGAAPSPASQPLEDGAPGAVHGDGAVPIKPVGGPADWGALPPAERERLLQQLQRDYPAHYRAIVEQYFRSLSTEEAPSASNEGDAP